MPPDFHLNFPAVLAAFLIEVLLGYLWYGRWFGGSWSRELGFAPNQGPMPSLMRRARYLRWISLIATILVLAVIMELIRPSTWGAGVDGPAWVYAVIVSVAAWVGFCATPLLSRVAWEGASWRLVRIHGAYHLLGMLVVCQILAYWR
jgi:hypothetical protein